MKSRCTVVGAHAYSIYGGRGIYLCDEWAEFEAFSAWALANGYRQDLTIDRIDNDLGYSPGNCRWATTVEQANNKRNNVVLVIDGERMTATQAAARHGLTRRTVSRRVKAGWPHVEAVKKLPPQEVIRRDQLYGGAV